jgi:hypothetical protein
MELLQDGLAKGGGQLVKPLTAKLKKIHEGNPENKAFVILRVLCGWWVLRVAS